MLMWLAGLAWGTYEIYQLYEKAERYGLMYTVETGDFMRKWNENPMFRKEVTDLAAQLGWVFVGIFAPPIAGKGVGIGVKYTKKQVDKIKKFFTGNKKGKKVSADELVQTMKTKINGVPRKLEIHGTVIKDPTGKVPPLDIKGMSKDQQKMALNFLYQNTQKLPTETLFGKIKGFMAKSGNKGFKKKMARHGANRTINRIDPKI